jgi:hypothetical protein
MLLFSAIPEIFSHFAASALYSLTFACPIERELLTTFHFKTKKV